MKYGLIGEKLSHSYSAMIHPLMGGYEYELREIAPDKLQSFMDKREFSAINVTIPYKEKIIPMLDYVDERAMKIGAVNTVVNRDGKLYGYNTDFFGMSERIRRADIELNGKKVLILGSGGTSKTATAVAQDMGAVMIKRTSRTGREDCDTLDKIYANYTDVDVIINTTPCGMYPHTDESPVDIDRFEKLCAVVDVIYNPLHTVLLKNAENRGLKTAGGLYMLTAQAAKACEHFIGTEIGTEKTEEVYKTLLCEICRE